MKFKISVILLLSILVFGFSSGYAQEKGKQDVTILNMIDGYKKVDKLKSELEELVELINEKVKKADSPGKTTLNELTTNIGNVSEQIKSINSLLENFKGQLDSNIIDKTIRLNNQITSHINEGITPNLKDWAKLKEASERLATDAKNLIKMLSDDVHGKLEDYFFKMQLAHTRLKEEEKYLSKKKIRLGLLFGFDLSICKYRETSYFVNDDKTIRPAEISPLSSLISAVIVYEAKLCRKKVDFVVNIPLLEIPLFSDSGADKIDNIFNKLLDLGLGIGLPIGPNWSFNILISHSRVELLEDGIVEEKIFSDRNAHDKIDLSNIEGTVPRSKLSITFGFTYKFGKSSRGK